MQAIVVKIAYNVSKLLILYFYNSKTNNKENNDILNSVVRRWSIFRKCFFLFLWFELALDMILLGYPLSI